MFQIAKVPQPGPRGTRSCCRRLAVLAGLALSAAGCSAFSTPNDALTSYEYTQRQINGEFRSDALASEGEAKDESFSVNNLAPDKIGQTVSKAVGRGPNRKIAQDLYRKAEATYREATNLRGSERVDKFLEAAEQYESAAKRWPDSALEQDALYMTGESHFFANSYPDANDYYEQLLKKYPHSRHLDTVEARRFSIAQYWLTLHKKDPESFYYVNLTDEMRPMRDMRGHALRIFNKIRIDDPTGKLADDATLASANEYFQAGDYLRADEFYTDLRTAFPSSEHQFAAHFLGMQAKLRSYKGSEYSGTALDEAMKLIETMRKSFPAEAQLEEQHLARAFAEIRFRQAEREWNTASYFERRGENLAARYYYDLVVADYSDTPFASKAQDRIASLTGEPDRPAQRLSWLVEAFPDPETAKPLIATDPGTQRR